METIHYRSTWNVSNIITVGVSLQDAGGSLWSSAPSPDLLGSVPCGCLALDGPALAGARKAQSDEELGPTSGTWSLLFWTPAKRVAHSLLSCTLVWIHRSAVRMLLSSLCAGCWRAEHNLVLVLHARETGLIWNSSWGKALIWRKGKT